MLNLIWLLFNYKKKWTPPVYFFAVVLFISSICLLSFFIII